MAATRRFRYECYGCVFFNQRQYARFAFDDVMGSCSAPSTKTGMSHVRRLAGLTERKCGQAKQKEGNSA